MYLLKNKATKSSLTRRAFSFVLMLSMILSMMIPTLGVSVAAADTGSDVVLMSLTKTSATVAETGNQFTTESGVFAGVSNLTAWSNNTQKVVGGAGKTPIVFNNAQTTGGWKPVSVAGLDNADAFQIKFSTLGYQNIRFTSKQKSTGSGPDAFLLAYSVGGPTGSYTVIPNSATGTSGIPAISRVSNDTYDALQATYDNFVLPSEMNNVSEIYLRVVFNGLTTLGANGNTSINDIVIIGDKAAKADVSLMSLTKTSATVAETGNQFTTESGVFAGVSNLTAWSNNTQKVVGGAGKTPIVFNNAQTTGGWKPVSVAGLDNADAFQIKFSTLGYQNIRFTSKQKSTGSGPDAFLLAYSVGNPTGPYTVIPNSATGTGGIPAISRVSNDNYDALQATYDNFVLPAEMNNVSEIYLRVVFNGLTTLGANGNTSINDIVIIGDEKGSGSATVNKTAFNAVLAEAALKIKGDYTAGTWAVFADAYQSALTVAGDNMATQQEVNAAKISLQSTMNALKRLDEVVDIMDWPGNGGVTAWDTTAKLLQDGSGLDFHDGKLYVVNNKEGKFWALDVALDGTLSYTPGFENGKVVRFKSNNGEPDTEGITVDGQGHVYFASERDNNNKNVNFNSILQVENPLSAATVFTATRQWDITASLPNVSANLGIEAVEWVSNADVAGKLFDANTNAPFDPANYPNATAGGVFFVALEDNGHVYAFVLYDNETFVRIADIDPKLGTAMALNYDEEEGVLWVKADDTKGNVAAIVTFTGTPTVKITHVNPPSGLNKGGNYEGFAIAPSSYAVNGQRPVYHIEDGLKTNSLMIGSISSGYVTGVVVDYSKLAEAIELAAVKVETSYTEETWSRFAAMLTEAQRVFADAKATQQQVDAAKVNLTSAMNALAFKIVKKSLSGIAITTQPTKTQYFVGENLDLDGIAVTGTYDDASTEALTVTAANITGFNSTAAATGQVVTVTVNGKTARFTVDIVATTDYIIGTPIVSITGLSATVSAKINIQQSVTAPATVIFQLMDGKTPVQLMAIKSTIQDGQEVTAQFNLPSAKNYTVKVLIWNDLHGQVSKATPQTSTITPAKP
ncbi:bacterial Ig-like domain-containing protein [Cohnella abietis]|uniref:Uncharacterized protein n=1 Tax=Cohnella abietis TaxID=2507935 RepID=A0A3T1CYP8_9BACL|nr:bacterial Ig-like domain-containing protein [Cohnella abietis]BBI30983.1 hypothetical protein KCTCHS21_03820 [Cohnella abietis]